MNIFVQTLAETAVESSPDLRPTELVVEDNVGEGVHIHHRNLRLEMSVEDFGTLADAVEDAAEQLDHGNR